MKHLVSIPCTHRKFQLNVNAAKLGAVRARHSSHTESTAAWKTGRRLEYQCYVEQILGKRAQAQSRSGLSLSTSLPAIQGRSLSLGIVLQNDCTTQFLIKPFMSCCVRWVVLTVHCVDVNTCKNIVLYKRMSYWMSYRLLLFFVSGYIFWSEIFHVAKLKWNPESTCYFYFIFFMLKNVILSLIKLSPDRANM